MKLNGSFQRSVIAVAVTLAVPVTVVSFYLNLEPEGARPLLTEWSPDFTFKIFIKSSLKIFTSFE